MPAKNKNSDAAIPACVILDDFPINGSYWTREQQTAFGFTPTAGGEFGRNWRNQAQAAWCPPEALSEFADLCEEFGVRGKFTVLPCPAGLGRIDQSVRGCPPGYIEGVLEIVRRRIAPRFDITPEVLTHSMAYNPRTGEMLPHTESAWVSHLAATGKLAELEEYLTHAWAILYAVGLEPRGVTIGGIPDQSGISAGQMLYDDHNRDRLGEVLLKVIRKFRPGVQESFIYALGRPTRDPYLQSWLPEPVWDGPGGARVCEIMSQVNDPLLGVMHADGDVEAEAAKMITADLSGGQMVECAEAGQAIGITIHAQTITSLNTRMGLKVLGIALRRFRERYGRRVQWMTPMELCAMSRERHG
ncbi:MAG: hypothetical protein K8S99_11610 [Planctomycetes bacterium]|nr:hypothetical protein [Planctomycetota bacterium]